jgi:hypothetical protein
MMSPSRTRRKNQTINKTMRGRKSERKGARITTAHLSASTAERIIPPKAKAEYECWEPVQLEISDST